MTGAVVLMTGESRRGFFVRGMANCPPPGISPEDVQGCVEYALRTVRIWLRHLRTEDRPSGPGDQEELESAALLGVAEAIGGWSELRGVGFSTFLSRAVSWRIQEVDRKGTFLRPPGRRRHWSPWWSCVSLEELDEDEGPSEDGWEGEADLRADVRIAVDALPEDLRVLVERHYLGGEPLVQVARDLGLPYRTAKDRLARARTALKVSWPEPEEW